MPFGRLVFLPLALGLAVSAPAEDASARSLRADYAVSVRGFPAGRAELRAGIDDRRYRVAFSGRVSGLARLFSDARTEAQATGDIGEDRPHAAEYRHVWTEDGDTESVGMRFAGRGVDTITLDPPRSRPERYVPMTARHKAEALDLVSAFLWPSRSGAAPETCDRTLPLIDGKRRFDIAFAFDRMESFATRNNSRHRRAVVCTVRYTPVSGHRADRENDGLLAGGDDMEVWLVAAGDGLVVPVRVQFTSAIGRVVMTATRLETE